ncbi:hypothetical protein JL721_12720 [Aureococcus anophagefferens]|nr:hypothetical protein JL721_12720 [Aureococcus anophagefferens]
MGRSVGGGALDAQVRDAARDVAAAARGALKAAKDAARATTTSSRSGGRCAKRGHVFVEGADALEAKLVGTLGQRAGVAQRDAWREHAAAELRARNLRAGDGASVAATAWFADAPPRGGDGRDRAVKQAKRQLDVLRARREAAGASAQRLADLALDLASDAGVAGARAVRDAAKRAALEAAWKDAKRLARRRSPLVAAAVPAVWSGAAALLDAVDAAADAVDVEDALRTYDVDACGDCVAVVDETHALSAPCAGAGETVCCDGEAEALLWKAGEAERRGDDFSYFAFSSLAKGLGVERPELRARFAAALASGALRRRRGRLARLCGVRGAGGPRPSQGRRAAGSGRGRGARYLRKTDEEASGGVRGAAASNDDDGGFDAALDVCVLAAASPHVADAAVSRLAAARERERVKSQAYELPRNCRDYAAALLFCADHADVLADDGLDAAFLAHHGELSALGVSREAEAPCFLRLCRGLFLEKKDGRFQSGRWLLHAPLDALALRLDGAGHWRLRADGPEPGDAGDAAAWDLRFEAGRQRARAPRTCWRGSRATRCSAATSPRRSATSTPREEAPEEVVAKDDDDDDDEPEIAPLKETPFDSGASACPAPGPRVRVPSSTAGGGGGTRLGV